MDTYEKKYKEALELARSYYDENTNQFLDTIFPELRESKDEDERIRKVLLNLVSNDKVAGYTKFYEERGITCDDAIAYLEKQKEIPMPNSTELIEMWNNEEAMLKEKDFRGDTWRIAYNAFLDGFARGTCVKFEKPNIEICPHSIKSKSYLETGCPIEQKPAEWSEEDEKMLNEVLERVTYAFYDQGNEGEIEDDPAFLWLHRLRPSWKPSEEQMKALQNAVALTACDKELARLYNQLKKL